jgi:hypothetical protein
MAADREPAGRARPAPTVILSEAKDLALPAPETEMLRGGSA